MSKSKTKEKSNKKSKNLSKKVRADVNVTTVIEEALPSAFNSENDYDGDLSDKKLAKLLGYDLGVKKEESRFLKFLPKPMVTVFAKLTGDKNKEKKLSKNTFFSRVRGKVFDSNEKQILKLQLFAQTIESLEKKISKMTQEQMKNETEKLKKEFQKKLPADTKLFLEKGKAWFDTKQGSEVLDFMIEKMPLAFALVREAAHRTSSHKHFEVQLMAGIALSQGRIVEFKTGEGKTLVAPLALYIFALFGRGAHLVTVNDYLARRDGEWVGHMLDYLGISLGIINQNKAFKYVSPEELEVLGKTKEDIKLAKAVDWTKYSSLKGYTLVETNKKEAYLCDITYGTNSEFGFDYLRDNTEKTFEYMNQRTPFFCVVDEVDSILIDEARTPLIISSSAEESNDLYKKFAKLVQSLSEQDYKVEEKERAVTLTPSGISKVEKSLGIDNLWSNTDYARYLDRALIATYYYKKDDQYIIHNGEIVLVDEFTGRLQVGRRLSDGIHQAIEAKEGVAIQKESRTVATITYQNYFRHFPVLAGMTGTALTEAEEFGKIYNLDVVEIPTNRPMIRIDNHDVIYKNEDSKFRAIVNDIQERHKAGQPVLVGTVSVEKSEKLAEMLKRSGVKHEILNAKNHAREAEIIASAGEKGAVTISTNMAGRGTDIKLGKGIQDLGGLYVVGTERHESRRIDNQLRGRSGRQGDPGESRFFLALDDEIMRIYGGDLIKRMLTAAKAPDDIPFESGFITRTIKSAQRKVEAENFDARKSVVDFDDVLNKQRIVIYNRRKRVMELFDEAKKYYDENKATVDKQIEEGGLPENEIRLRDYVLRKLKQQIEFIIDDASSEESLSRENINQIIEAVLNIMPRDLFEDVLKKQFNVSIDEFENFLMQNPIKERVREQFYILMDEVYDIKEKMEGFVAMREIEKYTMLECIDSAWIDHLENMEDIQSGAKLQGYGQKDPLNIYQNEGYSLFVDMMASVDNDIAKKVMLYTTRIERQARKEESKATVKNAARLAQEALEQAFKDSQSKSKKKK
jgi:preprotein translocase subunit SecA